MKFTTFGKKIACLFAALVLMLGIVCGCTTENPTPANPDVEQAQKNVEAVLGKINFDPTVMDSLTSNLTLVEKNKNYPDVVIEYTSLEEDVIKIEKVTDDKTGETSLQGTVTRPAFDDARIEDGHVKVTVTVKASQTVGDQVVFDTKELVFKVKAVSLDKFGTIKEIKTFILEDLKARKVALNTNDSKNGSKFCITYGRVLYQYSKSMVISDGTDSMVVYGDYSKKCAEGDVVRVQGQVYSYFGQIEFGDEQQVDKLNEGDKLINPITKEEIGEQSQVTLCEYVDMEIQAYTDALIAGQGAKKEVVDVNALLPFSGATYKLYAKVLKENVGCGDDYALEDPKTGTKVSIYHYATDGEELSALLDQYVGKYVYINCVTIDRYSSNDVFRVLWNGAAPVEADAPVLTDADKVKQAEMAVKNANLEDAYYNGQDFAFPTISVEGVTVEWAMDPASMLVDGKLVVEADGTAKLVATITCGEVVATAERTINVYKEMTVITVAEAKTKDAGTLVVVKGLVSAVYARGFVVTDATGSILVYKNSEVDVVVGDYVQVSGKAGAYPEKSTAYQIGSPSYEKLTETPDFTLPEAVAWVGADVTAAWAEVVAGKYNFAGPLVKMTLKVAFDGKYYNASVEGSEAQISISYPLESLKQYLVDGATINATLMPISYSNSKDVPKFFNFILVEVEVSDQLKADALVNGLDVPTETDKDFDLPTVEGVTWSMKEASAAATLEGTKVTVTRAEDNVEVVFVATATVGEATGTKEYTVVVKGTNVEVTYTTPAEAAEAVKNAENDGKEVVIKGYIAEGSKLDKYGNMVLKDLAGNTISIYGGFGKDADGNYVFPTIMEEMGLKAGLCVAVKGTYSNSHSNVTGTEVVATFPEETVLTVAEAAEALKDASKDGAVVMVEGVVAEGSKLDKYGNMDLTDKDGNTVKIYGSFGKDAEGNYVFPTIMTEKQITVGATVVIKGTISNSHGNISGQEVLACKPYVAPIEPTGNVIATMGFEDGKANTSAIPSFEENGITLTTNEVNKMYVDKTPGSNALKFNNSSSSNAGFTATGFAKEVKQVSFKVATWTTDVVLTFVGTTATGETITVTVNVANTNKAFAADLVTIEFEKPVVSFTFAASKRAFIDDITFYSAE